LGGGNNGFPPAVSPDMDTTHERTFRTTTGVY
jgi:hypothetical protein